MGFGCQCFDMIARTTLRSAMPLSDAEMRGLSFSMVAEDFRTEGAADGEEDDSADAEDASDDDPAASCPAFLLKFLFDLDATFPLPMVEDACVRVCSQHEHDGRECDDEFLHVFWFPFCK